MRQVPYCLPEVHCNSDTGDDDAQVAPQERREMLPLQCVIVLLERLIFVFFESLA
jgi:hypothetical protein